MPARKQLTEQRHLYGGIILDEIDAAPATPGAGRAVIYTDATGSTLLIKNDAGTVLDLGAGGTGGASVIQTEVNLGGPARRGRFTINDAAILAGSQMMIVQAGDPLTGKGTRGDENEMDALILRPIVTGAGVATVYWSSETRVKGNFKFNWIVG